MRSGPNQGHYISLTKSSDTWLIFDDENVEVIDEKTIQAFFGSSQEASPSLECGYILFYQAKDMDISSYEAMVKGQFPDVDPVSAD